RVKHEGITRMPAQTQKRQTGYQQKPNQTKPAAEPLTALPRTDDSVLISPPSERWTTGQVCRRAF
ncbi:hypothetical protein, partial [Paraburkholderia hospita]|uniref:hypothetical protein n=1 Tax=Paraburkholderia hospita TaxID=169430 RepID=UPI001A987975